MHLRGWLQAKSIFLYSFFYYRNLGFEQLCQLIKKMQLILSNQIRLLEQLRSFNDNLYICILLQMKEGERDPINLQSLSIWQQKLGSLYEQNLNLRMKYPTEPMKFYQPEQQIDAILTNLQEVTQQHIPIIIQSKILLAVLKLLNHPNSDINMRCIEFLHDLVAEEPQDDELYQMYYRMSVWLMENGLLECLSDTLSKLDEEKSIEEYEVALQILKMLETLLELWEQSVELLVSDTKIMDYLANRILPNFIVSHKTIDDNKFVGSDVLAYIISNSIQAQKKFHALCGMEILIECIRPYLSKNPSSSDEQQFLGNLFDILNILLINPELNASRIVYFQSKGNAIMLQFLKAKNNFSTQALKAIAYSFIPTAEVEQSTLAEELIEFGALKYLFPMLMRQGIKAEEIDQQRVIDENTLQIVYVLLRSTSQIYRMRVESKLTEKRFQKLEKIFQIRTEYLQAMGRQTLEGVQPEDYLELIKQGLAIVEIIDKIFCTLVTSSTTVKQKLIVLMKLYVVSPREIETTLNNIYNFIGDTPQKVNVQRYMSMNIPLLVELYNRQAHC